MIDEQLQPGRGLAATLPNFGLLMLDINADDTGADPFFEPIAQTAQTLYGQAGTPEARARLRAAADQRQARLNLGSLSAYAAHLRREPGEWGQLWAAAMPLCGAFLRPAGQFDLARDLISEWAVMAPQRELKVLSLGCGPGFETISLAICLEEAGLRAKNWQVKIFGLDLNPEAVRAADSGLFTSDDLEWLTDGQRRKWFAPRGGGFHFKAELAPAVTVAQGNAYEPDSWPFKDPAGPQPDHYTADDPVHEPQHQPGGGLDNLPVFDLIFCRGLSLEAPPRAPRQLARILRQSLSPSGFIFTAPGEFLPLRADDIYLEERGGATYYRRGTVKIKVNRHHQPRRRKSGTSQAAASTDQAGQGLPPREAQLLAVAGEQLAQGHLEAARALADEAVLAALERERPAPEAWELIAAIEERLGREDTAQAAREAARAVSSLQE